MAYRMKFKRRREGLTNYRKRLRLLLSRKPRLVVRKSLQYISAQCIVFDPRGDKTIVSATSKELKKLGWKHACDTVPAAYLTGMLVGKRCLKKGIREVVLDIGLASSTRGARVYALAKGALDAGLQVPVGKEVFPSEERIRGEHIKREGLTEKFEELRKKIGEDGRG